MPSSHQLIKKVELPPLKIDIEVSLPVVYWGAIYNFSGEVIANGYENLVGNDGVVYARLLPPKPRIFVGEVQPERELGSQVKFHYLGELQKSDVADVAGRILEKDEATLESSTKPTRKKKGVYVGMPPSTLYDDLTVPASLDVGNASLPINVDGDSQDISAPSGSSSETSSLVGHASAAVASKTGDIVGTVDHPVGIPAKVPDVLVTSPSIEPETKNCSSSDIQETPHTTEKMEVDPIVDDSETHTRFSEVSSKGTDGEDATEMVSQSLTPISISDSLTPISIREEAETDMDVDSCSSSNAQRKYDDVGESNEEMEICAGDVDTTIDATTESYIGEAHTTNYPFHRFINNTKELSSECGPSNESVVLTNHDQTGSESSPEDMRSWSPLTELNDDGELDSLHAA
ncbi:hypothetical protein EV360DRAFT_83207 [Lentinula raphanica]|nr:hypothetical protein EV360DRAFT_83207 [Lentinula raphanica]